MVAESATGKIDLFKLHRQEYAAPKRPALIDVQTRTDQRTRRDRDNDGGRPLADAVRRAMSCRRRRRLRARTAGLRSGAGGGAAP